MSFLNFLFEARPPKVGLVLGSGGPKGLAHIGVLKVLEENKIPIDFIVGSSIGAIVGALYAAKKDLSELENLAVGTNWKELLSIFFDVSFWQGFVKGEKLEKFLESHLGHRNFSDLKIPFRAVATDLISGNPFVFQCGKVVPAVQASSAIPLLFRPVKKGKTLLADGGLSLPVPVQVAKEMGAELIIAVNLEEDYASDPRRAGFGFSKIAFSSIGVLSHYLARYNVVDAHIVLNPRVGEVGWDELFVPEKSRSVVNLGVEVGLEKISTIEMLFKNKTKTGLGKWLEKKLG
jgi:NTE family protein